jgi:hypothetical protein
MGDNYNPRLLREMRRIDRFNPAANAYVNRYSLRTNRDQMMRRSIQPNIETCLVYQIHGKRHQEESNATRKGVHKVQVGIRYKT